MKVLQLGKFYPIRGGVEKVMYDLMLGLSAAGIDCDMLCASTENHPAAEIQLNKHAKLMVMPTNIKVAATMLAPTMIIKLRKIAKEYDIIHIHHPDPMATLALFLSGYKGKVILHWHSDILKQKTLLKLYKPLQNWIIKRADLIVGTTPVYVKESIFLDKVQNKVDYIPIGIEAKTGDSVLENSLKTQYPDKFIVFSLGRLVEYKGFEYLIKAATLLPDNFQILIGGKGPLESELKELISTLGLTEKVKLLGFLSDEDVDAYFAICDIFCLSSIWKTEAFAIVQIEAMAKGKPIVTADIPGSGVSWVNKDGISGIVVPTENPQALANAFKKIEEDKEFREKCIQGSLSRYHEFFSRDKMVGKCLHLYRKVLSN